MDKTELTPEEIEMLKVPTCAGAAQAAADAVASADGEPAAGETADEEPLLGLSVDEALVQAVYFAFDEATQTMEQGGVLTPFTVVVIGEDLYVENHPGDDVAECFESAQRTIYAMEKKIDSYVFCYDGYVELDGQTKDAIIVEAAKTGDEDAHAYAQLYAEVDDALQFEEGLADLGDAPTLFVGNGNTPFELEELADEAAAVDVVEIVEEEA